VGYYGPALGRTDSAAMAAWVDNYCQANPLDTIDVAAEKPVRTLRKSKQ
jgi:hypothetical protein